MTNPKIDKVNTQIAGTKAKISEYQAKLRELEREKTRLENEQFINIIRSEKISDAELTALMLSLRNKDEPADDTAQEIITQEEIRDATNKT